MIRALLKEKLDYQFKNESLLTEALIHPSMRKSKFELLEFLGDRVLGLIAATIVWEMKPSNEKEYAQQFTLLTNKEALTQAAQKLELYKYIEWRGAPSHEETIVRDACEALLGALFIDGGLLIARQFVELIWNTQAISVSDQTFDLQDPKSTLNNWANQAKVKLNYILVHEAGQAHNKTYRIRLDIQANPELAEEIYRNGMQIYRSTFGQGSSIRNAEKAAALEFLQKMLYDKSEKS